MNACRIGYRCLALLRTFAVFVVFVFFFFFILFTEFDNIVISKHLYQIIKSVIALDSRSSSVDGVCVCVYCIYKFVCTLETYESGTNRLMYEISNESGFSCDKANGPPQCICIFSIFLLFNGMIVANSVMHTC